MRRAGRLLLTVAGVGLAGSVAATAYQARLAGDVLTAVAAGYSGTIRAAMGPPPPEPPPRPRLEDLTPSEFGWETVRRINVDAGIWEGSKS